jgi:hypothetical protein
MVTASPEPGTVFVDQSAATLQSPLTAFFQLMAVMLSLLVVNSVSQCGR